MLRLAPPLLSFLFNYINIGVGIVFILFLFNNIINATTYSSLVVDISLNYNSTVLV